MDKEIIIKVGLTTPLEIPDLAQVSNNIEEDIRDIIGKHFDIDDIYNDIDIEIFER